MEVMLAAHILSAVAGYNLYISKIIVGERPDNMTFKKAYSYVRWATIAACGFFLLVFIFTALSYIYGGQRVPNMGTWTIAICGFIISILLLCSLAMLLVQVKLVTQRLLKIQIVHLRPFFTYFAISFLFVSTVYLIRAIIGWDSSAIKENSIIDMVLTILQQVSYDIIATAYLSCKHGINLTRSCALDAENDQYRD